jgi:hypothetical protein
MYLKKIDQLVWAGPVPYTLRIYGIMDIPHAFSGVRSGFGVWTSGFVEFIKLL